MIEPKTTTVDQLAKRWSLEPTQILEAAIGGQIGLYFRLGYCVVADLPNLSPGRLLLRPYQGELQVDIPTLQCILYHGEARNVQEAYLPGGGRVYVELPPKEGPPGVQLTTPLNIKIENLSALMDEVKAHELKDSGAVVESTGVERSNASAPGVDSANSKLEMPMKKAALIAALEHEWRSIKADLSEAARNGLKAAAHAGIHGHWNKARAREWALSKGKIRQAAQALQPEIWPGTVTRNCI